MRNAIETANATRSLFSRLPFNTAPSLRVPVTANNRAYLRRLRAAELSAWEAADRNPPPPLWLLGQPFTV